jgi:glucose/arabinose dehydrogenase
MGPKGGDEINLIKKGKNYGWPVVSEGVHYDGTKIPPHSRHPEFVAPSRWWGSSISPSGLLVYTGARFPKWRGNLLMGGLSSKALFRLTLDGTSVTNEERIALDKRIRDVAQAPDGAVLLLTDEDDAELLRLTPG